MIITNELNKGFYCGCYPTSPTLACAMRVMEKLHIPVHSDPSFLFYDATVGEHIKIRVDELICKYDPSYIFEHMIVIMVRDRALGRDIRRMLSKRYHVDPKSIGIISTASMDCTVDLLSGLEYTKEATDVPVDEVGRIEYALTNYQQEKRRSYMKFTNIITNPPYQSSDNEGQKAYKLVVKHLITNRLKDNGTFTSVNPNGMFLMGDTVSEIVPEFDIPYINIDTDGIQRQYFPNVGETFCYYSIVRRPYKTTTIYEDIECTQTTQFNISEYGYVPVPPQHCELRPGELIELIETLINSEHNVNSQYPILFSTTHGHKKLIKSEGNTGTVKRFKEFPNMNGPCDEFKYEIIMYNENANNHGYTSVKMKDHDLDKIVIDTAYAKNLNAAPATYFDRPLSVGGNGSLGYITVPKTTPEIGKQLETSYNCSLVRMIHRTVSGRNTKAHVIRWLPAFLINDVKELLEFHPSLKPIYDKIEAGMV